MRKLLIGLLAAGAIALPVGLTSAAEAPRRPALATCFWEGPISTNQPDDARLRRAQLQLPRGVGHLLARPLQPARRTRSLVLQRPLSARPLHVAERLLRRAPTDTLSPTSRSSPDPGTTNPFLPGAPARRAPQRSWTVTVLDEPPPAGLAAAPNTLYAQPAAGASIELALPRVRARPRPRPHRRHRAAARRCSSSPTAARRRAPPPATRSTTRTATITGADRAGGDLAGRRAAPPCDPQTNPAYDPVRWERFFNLELRAARGDQRLHRRGPAGAPRRWRREVQGGFYSNRDSAYIYAHLSRDFGPLLVVRGKAAALRRAPTREPARMPDAQASLLVALHGRVAGHDPHPRLPRRPPGPRPQRPRLHDRRQSRAPTARRTRAASCGVAWLDWGERGDGAGDPDYGLLIMRNMLVSPDFEQRDPAGRPARPRARGHGLVLPPQPLHDHGGVREPRLRRRGGLSGPAG